MLFLMTSANFSLDFLKNGSVISHDQKVLASQNSARIIINLWSLHSYIELNSICSAMASKSYKMTR